MTNKKAVLVFLAVAVVFGLPFKQATDTRGNIFRKGVQAPVTEVVVMDNPLTKKTDRLKEWIVPIDWANPLATQVTHPKNPNKAKEKK